ncbi:hypothetical protein SLE2022_075910 [Rubroshorea leprosula]
MNSSSSSFNNNNSSSSSSSSRSNNATSLSEFEAYVLNSLIGSLKSGCPPEVQNNPTFHGILAMLKFILGDKLDLVPDHKVEERHRAHVLREECKVEQEVIRIILSGNTDSLKANSGEAVYINNHYLCMNTHHEEGDDEKYRVWEWHGHIVTFHPRNGFSLEHFYGNYFEPRYDVLRRTRVEEQEKERTEEKQEPAPDMGLRGLNSGLNGTNADGIVHRDVNPDSRRFV